MDRQHIDLERYFRGRVQVRNEGGGRGYDRGVRTFDCPLCGDHNGRAWFLGWGVGCFNAGCDAQPRLVGGVVEWVRRVEGLATRTEAWGFLARNFGTETPIAPPAPKPFSGADFVRWPEGARAFETPGSPFQETFVVFARRQWGLSLTDLQEWGCRWTMPGPRGPRAHPWRIVIPIVMGGAVVAWQARAVSGAEPKYLTSRHGEEADPDAECGRPAASLLFNLDAVTRGGDVVLVEGAGDVMRWHRGSGMRARTPTAVAILGVALTPQKLALLADRNPERVIVALDAEPEAQERARTHVVDLRKWDVSAALGLWTGAKDAGAGADLGIEEVPQRREHDLDWSVKSYDL